ncbi:sulfate adenylyltransferase subunit CysN [Methylobrevis albus]|uniref:Multifunctional fusion protein n=1 Tax=Methylobrevis albus TaxID=2793297 RepID=A0A931MXF1_9HYPH|nr:sulfate adenylyltransferase subunit CysN [Methylobrevis albus]MBH0236992.1 sulfate adenylyltransferase subunit CysN [Methylobrevis albus]
MSLAETPVEELGLEAFQEYLARHETKTLLRFLTCGSVDDGKSTLIGRLLYDTKLLFEDQLKSLERDSRRHGTVGEEIDFALLVDGLEAEREQGITIDVAYRFFATDRRKFIVADTPGHEQYTRNMATGASTADLAVILVDSRQGILTQTRRHSFIASLLGIRHVVLAVNKIDLMGYSQEVFDKIAAEYRVFAADFGFKTLQAIPLSARYGDNVLDRSPNMGWYTGPTLVEHLETVEVTEDLLEKPFRLPVQFVNRPNLDFRGFAGTIASGRVRPGDPVVVAKSGRSTTVKAIVSYDGEAAEAVAGEAVTLTLTDEIDISRGDLLSAPTDRPDVSDQFAAHLIWMADEPLLSGRPYLLKIGPKTVSATVTEIKHKIDVNSFNKLAAKTLALNEVALVNFALAEPVAFDPYASNRETGAFIVIDRMSNQTVGAGMVDFGLRRADNIHWQALDVSKESRAAAKGQKPVVIWLTGLSGAGKSTIANLVEKKLHLLGRHTYTLDGDNVRHGLNRDLGFTDADRVENIRRVAETAKLFVDAGLIVMVSFISPFRSERLMARELMGPGEFIEVHVDTPLEIAEARDVKGLYRKARAGQIKNFTGIDSPYEPPESAELVLAAGTEPLEALADRVVAHLKDGGYIG